MARKGKGTLWSRGRQGKACRKRRHGLLQRGLYLPIRTRSYLYLSGTPFRAIAAGEFHATNDPIFVTKNGYGDMVVMSMAAYEQRLAQAEMYNKIMEGKAQADGGNLLDGQETMAHLRAKYAK